MEKPFLSFIMLFTFLWTIKTEEVKDPFSDITLCHSVPEGMAKFVSDPEFASFHPSPLEINYQGKGEMTQFDTPDGKSASGYLVKANSPTDQWLFVYQEWWGLNEHIKKQADVFYKDLGGDVNVIALDMYDGQLTADPAEAGKLMQSANETRLEDIVQGAMKYAGKEAKIANIGWCFGGGWSLKSALITGDQNIGSVMYYGMPVQDLDRLKTLNSDVLGLFATEQYISQEIIEKFADDMETAGKELTYKIFPAAHGFANPSNPRYDEKATKEAYAMAITYLKAKFETD